MYNFSVLQQAVNDYLYEESERKCFLKTWKGGWWESLSAEEREKYIKYEERTDGKWNTVAMMCKLLEVDADRLIPVIKSINRWENRGKYDRCFHFGWRGDEDRVKLFISNKQQEKQYYQSTGRKILT